MEVKKKILVIVRDRAAEALRLSAGLLGCDDQVEVFILNKKLERTDEINKYLEFLEEFEVQLYSNNRNNNFDYLTLEALAHKLSEYDLVIPY
jgi:hypothetical protein